jgi:hypothetical protein
VEHFSLAQLMADSNLLRNVLNDVGAQPSEVFLLVAALEARVPQALIEHSATDDLSVVEPRLVTELNDRGIERARAEWAVAAWKEVVGGSTLGQPTVRPTPSPIVSSEPQTVRPSQPTPAAPAPAAAGPVAPPGPPSTVPTPQGGGARRKGVIAAAIVVALLVVGVVVWVARPKHKDHAANSQSQSPGASTSAVSNPPSSRSSASSSVATSASSAPTGDLAAPLGPPITVTVPGTKPWTDTHMKVTKGERINITATGQITNAPGRFNGPGGAVGNLAIYSILGGGNHHAALIGLIAGTNSVFLIGADYNGLAAGDGELYLGINDVGVNNNSGEYTTTVRLQQS